MGLVLWPTYLFSIYSSGAWVSRTDCLTNLHYNSSCTPLPPLNVPWLMKAMIALVFSILPFHWHWCLACTPRFVSNLVISNQGNAAEMLVVNPWMYIWLPFFLLNITKFLLLQFSRVLNSFQLIFDSFSMLTMTLRSVPPANLSLNFCLSWWH